MLNMYMSMFTIKMYLTFTNFDLQSFVMTRTILRVKRHAHITPLHRIHYRAEKITLLDAEENLVTLDH